MQCSCRRSPEDTKGKQMSLARFTVAHLEKTYSLSLVMLRKTWNISPESMLSRCQAGDEAGYSMDLPCGPCSPNCATEKIKSGTSTWPKEVVAFAIVVATFDSSIFNSQSLNFLTTFIHCHMFFFFVCVCVSTNRNNLWLGLRWLADLAAASQASLSMTDTRTAEWQWWVGWWCCVDFIRCGFIRLTSLQILQWEWICRKTPKNIILNLGTFLGSECSKQHQGKSMEVQMAIHSLFRHTVTLLDPKRHAVSFNVACGRRIWKGKSATRFNTEVGCTMRHPN